MLQRAVIFAVLLVALAVVACTWESRSRQVIIVTAMLAFLIAIGALVWERRLPPHCFCFFSSAGCCGG
jgi:hypothetical protein